MKVRWVGVGSWGGLGVYKIFNYKCLQSLLRIVAIMIRSLFQLGLC